MLKVFNTKLQFYCLESITMKSSIKQKTNKVISLTDKQIAFLNNYQKFLPQYIADGNPSLDTLNSYWGRLESFLKWCKLNGFHPFKLQEAHIILYRKELIDKGFKTTSIAAALTSIRKFYNLSQKLKLITDNPALDIKAPRNPDAGLINLPYLTAGKLEYLLQLIKPTNEKNLRDKVIIAFMAIEGLRTIEIHRMNEEDINKEQQSILIRGKGKNTIIYPRPDTFNLLLHYIETKKRDFLKQYIDNEEKTPVFTSTSNHKPGNRINRRNIREAVDLWLERAGYKEKGKSDHMLRHTCATLLYKETKDLKIVQETLRHSNINMSSKYAHLVDREDQRYTKAIPVEL